MKMKNLYLDTLQTKAEMEKCLQCPSKPCMHACPAYVSPKDFIAAAKNNKWQEAAQLINEQNPMGEICGLICPDTFCVKACVRAKIDAPVNIPQLQASIMHKARIKNTPLQRNNAKPNGKKIAVIGSGPAGCAATAELLKNGFSVTVFEKDNFIGGALNLIPEARLPREIITYEWQHLTVNPLLKLKLNCPICDYSALLQKGFTGVVVAIGEQKPRSLGIDGEEFATLYTHYLAKPQQYITDQPIAVIGGGAVAVDCAVTAKSQGAAHVEMFVRRGADNMRITSTERQSLLENAIEVTTMTRPLKIEKQDNDLILWTTKTRFNSEGKLEDIPNTATLRTGFKHIVLALGSTRKEDINEQSYIVYAGDVVSGGSTAVQAIADGKKAAKRLIDSI
jgi:dihydropyrimidine dehydrogenase (NAD+) subunit PreT